MVNGSGMLIRQYAYDQARKHPGKEIKILSERELCKVFSVSRPTVRKALDELVSEDMLIIHKGKGTFTNPSMSVFRELYLPSHKLSVGIVVSSGQNVVYDHFFWDMISGVGQVICDNFGDIRMVQTASDNEKLIEEIMLLQLDALIWIHPTEIRGSAIETLQSRGLPVMCVNRMIAGDNINYVSTDFYTAGKNAAKYLLDKGHKTQLFIAETNKPSQRKFYDGYCDMFNEYGLELDERLVVNSANDIINDIKNIIRFKIEFTACFAMGDLVWSAIEAFKQAGVSDYRTKYELLTTYSSGGKYLDCAFVNINPYDLGKRAALELTSLVLDKTIGPVRVKLSPEVIEHIDSD